MKPAADWRLTEQPEQQAQTQRAPPAHGSAHSADRQKHANFESKASEKFRPYQTNAWFNFSVRGAFRTRQTGVSGSGKFRSLARSHALLWRQGNGCVCFQRGIFVRRVFYPFF